MTAEQTVTARRRNLRGWMFIGPVVIGTLLFNVLPVLPTLVTSFTDWDGLAAPKFTGVANYQEMFSGQDPLFGKSLINTAIKSDRCEDG